MPNRNGNKPHEALSWYFDVEDATRRDLYHGVIDGPTFSAYRFEAARYVIEIAQQESNEPLENRMRTVAYILNPTGDIDYRSKAA